MDSWVNDWIATYLRFADGTTTERVLNEYAAFFGEHAGYEFPDQICTNAPARHSFTFPTICDRTI